MALGVIYMAQTSEIWIEPTPRGMIAEHYITETICDTGEKVWYGPFDSLDKAESWAKELVNATILPVSYPTYNRG